MYVVRITTIKLGGMKDIKVVFSPAIDADGNMAMKVEGSPATK